MAESKKIQNIRRQLAPERDFPDPPPPSFQYAICCTHRAGTNMLSEGLYQTGVAGDPIEYFNMDFVRLYGEERGQDTVNIATMLSEMRRRRTSPNGVFGLNVKFDQLKATIGNVRQGLGIVARSNAIIFLYRRNKIRQAVSTYKGQVRGTFNLWTGDDDLGDRDQAIPFRPARIAVAARDQIQIEQHWLAFFRNQNLAYHPIAFEDMIADYQGTLADVLAYMGIGHDPGALPDPPTQRMRDARDDHLIRQFLDYLDPDRETLLPRIGDAPGASPTED